MIARRATRALRAGALLSLLALCGCSVLPTWMGGDPGKPKPAELAPNPRVVGAAQAWTSRLGKIEMPLSVAVNGSLVTVASSDGSVAVIDADTGAAAWRTPPSPPAPALAPSAVPPLPRRPP